MSENKNGVYKSEKTEKLLAPQLQKFLGNNLEQNFFFKDEKAKLTWMYLQRFCESYAQGLFILHEVHSDMHFATVAIAVTMTSHEQKLNNSVLI